MQSILADVDRSAGAEAATASVKTLADELGAALHVLRSGDGCAPVPTGGASAADPPSLPEPGTCGTEVDATWAILRRRAEQTDADLIVLVRPSSGRPVAAAAWEQFRDLAFETGTPVLVLRSPIHLPILTAVLPLDGDGASSGELSAACYLLDCLQAARPLSHVRPLTSPEIHLLHATRDTPDYFGWLCRVERLIHTVEFHSPLPPRTRLREQLAWDVRVEDEIVRRMREQRAQLLMISGRWKLGRAPCGSAQDLSFLRRVPGPVMFLPWDDWATMRGEEAGAERHALQAD